LLVSFGNWSTTAGEIFQQPWPIQGIIEARLASLPGGPAFWWSRVLSKSRR
jgi:hypothetical protein